MRLSKHNVAVVLLAALGSPQSLMSAAHMNLHNFAGGNGDGASPQASLTLIDSTLYGMTEFGGSANNGTLFRINTCSRIKKIKRLFALKY